jgi:Protein of unknown function (DUF3108)
MTRSRMYRFFHIATFIIATLATSAAPAYEYTPAKYKINLAPSADLSYAIRAKQSGLQLDGNALIKWNAGAGKFTVATETKSSLVGKILDTKSEGAVDDYGLAPTLFTEKRFRKDATTTAFNRATKTISFANSADTYPIKGGEQDRNSAIWQLISVARGEPAKFKTGAEWTFFVAGQRDAEPWTFKVLKQEKMETQLGSVNAIHIVKTPPPDAKSQQLDIWLAPALEWYPVQLRFSDNDGDYIEQSLVSISKK